SSPAYVRSNMTGASRNCGSTATHSDGGGNPRQLTSEAPARSPYGLAQPLRERTAQLLDEAALSDRSRRELARVHYVLDHNR
ncbi:hypothetical protein ACH4GK_37365, partial [Streptomyces rimosus]